MNKKTKTIVCIVLAVWIFFMGFELGAFNEKKKAPDTPATTAAPVTQPTTAAQPDIPVYNTTNPPIENPTQSTTSNPMGEVTTFGPSGESTTSDNSAQSKDPAQMSEMEILGAVTAAMNKLGQEQNFTAVRHEKVDIVLDDLSLSSLKGIINSVIQNLVGEETSNITFVNGIGNGTSDDGDIKDAKVFDVIPPKDGFHLPIAGVKTATATKNGDSTTYLITLVEETTTFDSPVPQYNSVAFSYLDLTSLDLPMGASITDANMHYMGTTVSVTTDGQGRITNIHYVMPMDGNGSAKAGPLGGSATFHGTDDENWDITY